MKTSEWMILMMSVALVYCTDPCPMKQTCHECIQNPNCAWCAQVDVLPWVDGKHTLRKRCFSPNSVHLPCSQNDIVNPSNKMTVVRNIGTVNIQNIASHSISNSQSPVPLSPQKLDLQLRIDKPHSIFVTFLNMPIIRPSTTGNHTGTEEITQHTVELSDNSTSDINITYYSRCNGQHYGSWNFSNKCEDLQNNDEITFQIFLQAKNCSNDPNNWKKYISIYPRGINASLIIKLEVVCDCLCEREAELDNAYKSGFDFKLQNPTLLHQICSFNGDYVCGTCECNPNTYGERCECSKTDIDSLQLPDITLESIRAHCRQDNNSNICSGRGSCSCGICSCDATQDLAQQSYGRYCECTDSSCPYYHGLLCSGPDHGTCICGTCICTANYTGKACECLSDMFCLPPNSTQPCSGNGICSCGYCTCQPEAIGRYCEIVNTTLPDITHCRQDNNSNICSGRGSCSAGVCSCDATEDPAQQSYGRYCECTDSSCPYAHGLLCSGPDHGTCICGTCICTANYTREACECLSDMFCLPPNSTQPCSGNGICSCGSCYCQPRAVGQYCEIVNTTIAVN